MRKRFLFIIGLLALTFLLIPPVSADNETTLSFTDMNLMAHVDIQIYMTNGTLLGIWNSSTPGIMLAPGAYNVVLVPSTFSRVTNPVTMLLDGLAFVETYWIQIILLLGVLGILIRKW